MQSAVCRFRQIKFVCFLILYILSMLVCGVIIILIGCVSIKETMAENDQIDGWAVVHFISTNETASVPKTWLQNNYCYWPDSKIKQKLTTKATPDTEKWTKYEINILKEIGSYNEGREYEKMISESDTDNISDEEYGTSRKGKKKKYRDFVSDFSDNESGSIMNSAKKTKLDENELSGVPVLKKSGEEGINLALNKISVPYNKENQDENRPPNFIEEKSAQLDALSDSTLSWDEDDELNGDEDNEDASKMPPPKNTKVLKTVSVLGPKNADQMEINNENYFPLNNNYVADLNRNENGFECCCQHGQLIKTVMQQVVAIKNMLNENTKILELNVLKRPEEKIVDFDKVPVNPFKSYAKLIKYDELLRNNEDARKQLETAVYLCGGSTRKEAIRRGLGKFFTDKLARKCSWTGRKDNFPLKHLETMTLIKTAVRKRFNTTTDREYEEEVSVWFRQAELRHQRSQQKKGE